MLNTFTKQLIFILAGIVVIATGVLVIRGATVGGNIKISGGYQQYGSGKPVAWWKMDEASWNGTAGEVKDAIGTNHGTAVNGANTTATAVFGRAGSFDGTNDYVTVSDASSVQNIFDSGGTFDAWIRPASDGGGSVGRVVDKTDGTGTEGWMVYVTDDNGSNAKIGFQQMFASYSAWETTSRVLTLGVWNHIVVVYDNTSLTNNPVVYINGSSVALTKSGSPSGSRGSDAGNNLYLGNRSDGARAFDGLIDDIRIYDYALTADQVRQVYNETAKLKINPILGHDLDLDATYYAQAANNTIHDITTQDISISAWVKVDSDEAATNKRILTKRSDAGNTEGYVFLTGTDHSLQAYIKDSDGHQYSLYGSTSYLINDNKWHYVSAVFDRDTTENCKIFFDGVDITLSRIGTLASVENVTNTAKLTLGALNDASSKLDGQIRDVKLYYAAGDHWTDAQILYQAQHPFDYSASAGTLTDYWRCDEGSGLVVGGKPSVGYNLTLSNALAWTTQPVVKMSTGLVGWWKMDDNADNTTVRDYSRYANTGTFNDATGNPFTSAHTTTTAQIGRAMVFDGTDDYVDISNNSVFNFGTNDFSYSVWFKTDTTKSQIIMSKRQDVTHVIDLYLRTTNPYVRFLVNDGSSGNINNNNVAINYADNNWHYVVLSYDAGNFGYVYLDGELVDSGNVATVGNLTNTGNLTIGRYADSNGGYFNGLIDDVRIFNYARTAEQIKNDFRRGELGHE